MGGGKLIASQGPLTRILSINGTVLYLVNFIGSDGLEFGKHYNISIGNKRWLNLEFKKCVKEENDKTQYCVGFNLNDDGTPMENVPFASMTTWANSVTDPYKNLLAIDVQPYVTGYPLTVVGKPKMAFYSTGE